MLPTIATALAEFVYDQDISFTLFTEPDEIPCFGCLTTIHRDARLLCVTEDSAKHIYLCYQDSRKKCGSVSHYHLFIYFDFILAFIGDPSRNPRRRLVLLESRLSTPNPLCHPRRSRYQTSLAPFVRPRRLGLGLASRRRTDLRSAKVAKRRS